MSQSSKQYLYELNLPTGQEDLRGRVPEIMSAEAARARFLLTRDALPKEVTVLSPVDTAALSASASAEIFVSPDGDDSAPGTKDAPLRTPAAALARAAGRGGVTVTLRGGSYATSAPLLLTEEHSGSADAPFILRAAPGEQVSLTGNTPLSTDRALWRVADPATDPVAARLPKAAQGKVICTTLAAQGLRDEDIPPIRWKREGPPSLYLNGEEYTLARYPNSSATIHDLLFFSVPYDTGTVTVRDGSDLYWTWVERAEREFGGDREHTVGWQIRLLNNYDNFENVQGIYRPDPTASDRAAFLLSWVNTGNIWYYGSTFEGWEFGYYNLADKTEGQDFSHYAEEDTDEVTPLLGAFVPDENGPYTYRGRRGYYSLKSKNFNHWGCKHSGNSPAGCNTFYLFNAIEALDEPGEWFYDRDTGILYVYPKDEATFFGGALSSSSREEFAPLVCRGLSHAVIDGITVDGSGEAGVRLEGCLDLVLQHLRVTNTKKENLLMQECRRCAVLYSDFSASATVMMQFNDREAHFTCRPSLNVVQNCFFHDAKPTRQLAINLSGCRVVISHNYFRNTCIDSLHASECIVEYNRFEGGSADVVDGGMYYASGPAVRNNHIRYNLFHMFNATHQAIYFDTMCGGNYAYYNIVSTLGSKTNRHKGWYSSTGMGNVCFGNLMVFRDPWEVARASAHGGDEVTAVGTGDSVNQSALFYYYFGNEHAALSKRRYRFVEEGRPELYTMDYGEAGARTPVAQSLAGHWWEGMKAGEVKTYLREHDPAVFATGDPAYVMHLFGTAVVLDALENSDYRVKYFYLPARLTGKSYTSSAAPAGTEILIPTYAYLDGAYRTVEVAAHTVTVPADGRITLTYEELGAMERIRRAPAYCVIENNILLGGTPLMDEEQNIIGDVDEEEMISDNLDREGYADLNDVWTYRHGLGYYRTTRQEHNFLRYDHRTVLADAVGCDYRIREEIRPELAAVLEKPEYEAILSLDADVCGPTYDFDYASLGPVQL